MSVSVMPSAIMPTTVATGMRSPRIQGMPPICLGFTVIRVKVIRASDLGEDGWKLRPLQGWSFAADTPKIETSLAEPVGSIADFSAARVQKNPQRINRSRGEGTDVIQLGRAGPLLAGRDARKP